MVDDDILPQFELKLKASILKHVLFKKNIKIKNRKNYLDFV